MFRALRGGPPEFHRAKRAAITALALGLMMWLVAFLSVRVRVVPHVAIKDLEWSRRRVPHVHRHQHCAADRCAGGLSGSALILA